MMIKWKINQKKKVTWAVRLDLSFQKQKSLYGAKAKFFIKTLVIKNKAPLNSLPQRFQCSQKNSKNWLLKKKKIKETV